MRHSIIIAAVALAAAACQPRTTTDPSSAVELRSATGVSMGTLTLRTTSYGVRINGTLSGLTPGAHGIHIHSVGRCDAPGFDSAGPHMNPGSAQHGLENPAGSHAGDLPNITANANGTAQVDMTTGRTMMSEVLDADGSAIVVHAAADDQRTDPSGGSGARVACGVVR